MNCPKCENKMLSERDGLTLAHKCPMCNFEMVLEGKVRKDYTNAWIHVCDLDVKFIPDTMTDAPEIVHYADVEFIARRYMRDLNAYVCEVVTSDENDGRFAAVSHDLFEAILEA